MRFRGRPVLGAFAGFFFELFLALDLVFFRVVSSGSPLVALIPVITLVGGLALAFLAPFGRERIARRVVVAEGSTSEG